jgi:hypothetical protein
VTDRDLIERLEKTSDEHEKRLGSLEALKNYVIGAASAIGLVFGVAVQWIVGHK